MTAQPISSLPPETMPVPHRTPDAGSSGVSFVALLAPTTASGTLSDAAHAVAATIKTDGRTSAAAARPQRASDKKSADDNGGASAGAVAPPPVQQTAPTQAAGTSSASTAGSSATPSALPAAAVPALLLSLLPATPAPSSATDIAPAPVANMAADAATPAAAANAASSSGAVPFAAMAAELGLRIAAGAPALTSQPRVALADLAGSQDKLAAAAAAGANHSALSLETLQGLAKPAAPAGAAIDEKTLADAAQDIAVAATSLEHASGESSSTQQTGNAVLTGSTGSTDATATTAMAPPPPAPIAAPPAPLSPTMLRAAELVALVLPQAVKSSDGHIQIQLQPAELGGIDVKLSVNHDGRVTMVVSADRSDTLNLLRQDSGTLTQALRDAGLQADNSSLSFNLRGGFSFNQQAFHGAANGAVPSSSDRELSDVTLPSAALQRRHAGSLDIHV